MCKQNFLSHMPLTLYKTFAWQTFASLRLFTCLVYVSTYCVPIALLRQNKPFPLLYLGHAQIINIEAIFTPQRRFSWSETLPVRSQLQTSTVVREPSKWTRSAVLAPRFTSSCSPVPSGVAQGCILGPLAVSSLCKWLPAGDTESYFGLRR